MEKWFHFSAYDSPAAFGYGDREMAEKYCGILNRNRETNVYGYREMADTETAELDSGADTDGFRLDLALDAQVEIDEENARFHY